MTVQTVYDEIHQPADLQVQDNNSQIPNAKQDPTPIITSLPDERLPNELQVVESYRGENEIQEKYYF